MLQEVVPLNLGEKWVQLLWAQLVARKNKREDELNEINNSILYSDPLSLAEVYIEPFCQEVNPADRHDEDFFIAKEPLFKKITEFLKLKIFQQGNNQLFILSDAGMGKTSSLVMMKLLYLSSFWPKDYSCVLEKLNVDSINKVNSIRNKRKTVLLLDSLDEDPSAYGRVRERLLEILEATKSFSRVIITCRTQFFPAHEDDPLEVPGRIKIGPFICPSKYLSVFDENQVSNYLFKRFPKRLIFDKNSEKRKKAADIVSRMGSLRCRPMLLSFIEDLVDSSNSIAVRSEYTLYQSLVRTWLIREEAKTGLDANLLLSVCARLAFEMQSRKMVKISGRELEELINCFEYVEKIKYLDIKGRSLLNKNSDGDYRFSHYSIQEYLVVYFILELAPLDESRTIFPTDFIKQLLEANTEKINERFEKEKITYQDFVESKSKGIPGAKTQEFFSEKEILDLLSEYSDELKNMDIEAFRYDLDVPTYLRNIIASYIIEKVTR